MTEEERKLYTQADREDTQKTDAEEKIRIKKRFLALYTALSNADEALQISQASVAKLLGVKEQTFKDTIKPEKNLNCNEKVVISFCHRYSIDPYDVIFSERPVEDIIEEAKNNMLTKRNMADAVLPKLTDEHFYGTFYGYSLNSQHKDKLDSFELKIFKDANNVPCAELNLSCYFKDTSAKDSTTYKKHLSGTPVLIMDDLILIVFYQLNGNEMYIFSYNYFKYYSTDRIFCRQGALLSAYRGNMIFPQIQSFIITDKKIARENLNYISSLLKLSNVDIIVSDDKLQELLQTNEYVKAFYEQYPYEFNKVTMCSVDEVSISSKGINGKIDKRTVMEVITALKSVSENPGYFYFPDLGDKSKMYSKFVKELQEQ